jgi:hypothetical protein
MKLPIAFSIVALAIGIVSNGFAGPAPVSGAPGGVTTQPVISSPTSSTSDNSTSGITPPGTGAYSGGTGSSGSSSSSAAATPNESNTDGSDDTLYRGKTSETENPMMRDEGPLHFKTRPKEKVQEVDSLKKLPSSGTDPKFQGSLLHSGISSIESLGGEKANEADAADEVDPRFKTKRLTFTPVESDESKKAKSDSTPSPTPSPTASPTAKDTSRSKE